MVKKYLPFLFFVFTFQLRAETLRVATYNVNNYNTEYRVIDGKREGNYPKPEKQKAALRTVIEAANADILALQEIGGEAFVEELRRDLKLDGLDYPYAVSLAGPDGKRQLAVLSKKPFTKNDSLAAIPVRYSGVEKQVSRGLLAVSFATDSGDEFMLYVVHLKSRLTADKSDPQSAAQRLAEATAVRAAVAGKHSGDAAGKNCFLVLGDFNDAPNSAPLRRFSGTKENPFLTMLPARDSRGEVWTYRNDYDGFYDRSDFIFASPAILEKLRPPARIVDLPATRAASDHRLVFIDLVFEKT